MSELATFERGRQKNHYRSPEAEQVLVGLLVNAEDRDRFLGNRSGYLANWELSNDEHKRMLQIEDTHLLHTATQLSDSFDRESGVSWNISAAKPTFPCSKSTFADLYCDG